MKNKEHKRIVLISYFVSTLGTFILSYLKVNNQIGNSIFSSIKVSTLLTLWWWFYFKMGWKIPYLSKILYRINLNGTWFGTYESLDIKMKKEYAGEIGLRINQDFLNISIKTFTEKYQNYSYSEELKFEEKSNIYGIVYVYSQKDNNSLDLNQRNGTSELLVKKYKDILILEGEFWTVMGTKGKLKATKVSNKVVDTFREAKELSDDLNTN